MAIARCFAPRTPEALTRAREPLAPGGAWPCYFAPSDTAGEKPVEEFCAASETVDGARYPNINVVTRPKPVPAKPLERRVNKFKKWRQSGRWTKYELLNVSSICGAGIHPSCQGSQP